jgi:epoxyqueuosine reductase
MFYQIEEKAKDLGFIKVGFSKPGRPLFFDKYISWIAAHKNAGMTWMDRNIDIREDPSRLLSGCNTIISLAYPYPSSRAVTPDGFTVSRYCQPTEIDYHRRLKILCRELTGIIKQTYPESISRVCVDSAPILERSFAYSAGIGFIGKNNMLIIPGFGSFFFLAEILTTASLNFPETVPIDNLCSSCSICIESCPSGALEDIFRIDAGRCLSYLTIERDGPVSPKTGILMDKCFFGCDRCQEVCPFNNAEKSREIVLPETDEWLQMTEKDFKESFGSSVLARAGLEKIKSNIIATKKGHIKTTIEA